jgi:peptidoglycan/xylan/chitin deacetylase (PgdA/CDA1 family)
VKRAAGVEVHYFRPPGGDYNEQVLRQAVGRGYVTTLWTDDPSDYSRPGADVILQRSLDHLENGAIILFHDGIKQTAAILPAFIAEARKRGFEFVKVSDLERSQSASVGAQ